VSKYNHYTFRQKLGFFGLLWMAWLVGYGFGVVAGQQML